MVNPFAPYAELIARHRLATPHRIVFEPGGFARAGELARSIAPPGPAVLMVAGQAGAETPLADCAAAILGAAGFPPGAILPVSAEPTVSAVNAAVDGARALRPTLVVGVGGGSTLDFAKALAALVVNPGLVEDYLEGVGRGWTIEQPPLPCLAVPTTAGTGAEMTKNAVIADHAKGFKKSLRDPRMIPAIALLDPVLTVTVPRPVTAAGGMDALTQLIESCISIKRQPGPTALAHRALPGILGALPACCDRPDDLDARAVMSLASGISGICLANAGLALAHGVASGLGGLHPIPHGEICGILLPHTLRYNRDACAPELADALARFLGEDSPAPDTLDRGIAAIEALKHRTGIPHDLSHLGLDDAEIRRVAEASMGSSMTGNPVPMTPESIYQFLRPLM